MEESKAIIGQDKSLTGQIQLDTSLVTKVHISGKPNFCSSSSVTLLRQRILRRFQSQNSFLENDTNTISNQSPLSQSVSQQSVSSLSTPSLKQALTPGIPLSALTPLRRPSCNLRKQPHLSPILSSKSTNLSTTLSTYCSMWA